MPKKNRGKPVQWTEEERILLMQQYPTVKRGQEMKELLEKLSRHTRNAIREEAYRLGVMCYSDQYRQRADDILNLLEEGPKSTSTIAQALEIPVKSMYDLMKTLIKAGQVRKIQGMKENGHTILFWEATGETKPRESEPYQHMEKLRENVGNPFALML